MRRAAAAVVTAAFAATAPAASAQTAPACPAADDSIDARDGRRDVILCGAGRDTVRADARDRTRGCEHLKARTGSPR